MSDGSSLRQSWSNALNNAETHFRSLLTSPSTEWKRIASAGDSSTGGRKGKARATSIPELSDVIVHRNNSRGGEEIYRLVLEVPFSDELLTLEPWRAVLTTPELRQEWDPAVEEAHLLEMFDLNTRISKTNFTLGWPANPRDTVTISRTFNDSTALIDITTSLPRSSDEPAYLRPSPPYVRSNVALLAWCIQHIQMQTAPNASTDKKKTGKIRLTCFWQHDLKSVWNFGTTAGFTQQLSTMVLGLFKTVLKRGNHVPKLSAYGNGVSLERIRFQIDREALTVDYSIVPEDDEHGPSHGMDSVQDVREQRRLTRSIQCSLPFSDGWDVRVTTKASSEEVEQLPWSATATRNNSLASSAPDQVTFRLSHAALIDDHSVLKVKVVIERSSPSGGLRLNGIPHSIQDVEDRDPSSYFIPESIFQDISSAVDLSFNTISTAESQASSSSSTTQTLVKPSAERTQAADKTILSKVRRNYIYFSSLLQEPEAKWRRTTEARGVSITQLDSIDPTLVVYRAEATFVGVGLWDLYGAVVSPGAKIYWDKQHEDAVLLEDVNELTELWHYKTRPAWPVNGRDAVVLRTVYKSPTTIHVFSFSVDDSQHLFPTIPAVEPNVIRTQIDLQGWSIEALSPTTTQLTLLEQSDPKGWTNKTSIPQQMISMLAGIGEFAIKCGGPPVVTRLAGAKANDMKYDHERSSFRVEYEANANRRLKPTPSPTTADNDEKPIVRSLSSSSPVIECEIRCDIDTWAHSLDIVVDPPPQTISCLRRHRLSPEGGGLWLSLTHDALFVDEDRLLTIVRRSPGKEKGLVMVNGAKVPVDVEELSEQEVKALAKQKRVKPPRIPLDQPPVEGAIRKRKAEWDAGNTSESGRTTTPDSTSGPTTSATSKLSSWASAPRTSSPLTKWWSYAIDQATTTTQQAVAAISPAGASGGNVVPPATKLPMQYALEALAWVQESHSLFPATGWEAVAPEKGSTIQVQRKLAPEICPVIPVHKGSKVIEGISAEELAALVMEPECRKKWDDRLDSTQLFESYGGDAATKFVVTKTGFPWRDRGFYLASVTARAAATNSPSSSVTPARTRRNTLTSVSSTTEHPNGVKTTILCVSASFNPDAVSRFSPAKYNSYSLPLGRVYLDAWVLETLDPYTKENYAIPSTRCTRLVAVDFAGSIPAAVNTMINSTLPRAILNLETFLKSVVASPLTRLPASGFIITEKNADEHLANVAWKLGKKDTSRTLVSSYWMPEDKSYLTTILVLAPTLPTGSSFSRRTHTSTSPNPHSSHTQDGSIEEQITPRPSTLMLGRSPPRISPTSPTSPHSADVDGGKAEPIPIPASASSPAPLLGSSPSAYSPSSSPVFAPSIRKRTISASASSPGSSASILGVGINGFHSRGRTASSAFTLKGEVRPASDLVVAEIVVDSKMYPDGYDVVLRSGMRKEWKAGVNEFLKTKAPGQTSSSTSGADQPGEEGPLPLAYTIHTMPSSPLHSSGLNEGENPTRHLLRLTLPTAQYQISTVRDPLTGELRSAPPVPNWLTEMREGGGAVVAVEVRPRKETSGVAGTTGSVRGKVKAGKTTVQVNGKDAEVIGEKESLTTLGRDELLDDKVSKMGVLSRMPSEAEPLPDELKEPLAIADDLLDPAVTTAVVASNSSQAKDGVEGGAASEIDEGTPNKASLLILSYNTRSFGSPSDVFVPGKQASDLPSGDAPGPSEGPRVPHVPPSGLLGFWHAYNNPLARFTSGMITSATESGTKNSTEKAGASGEKDKAVSKSDAENKSPGTPPPTIPGALAVDVLTATSGHKRRVYPLSSMLVVALIAFLIGSLLRSLLSPADFVYVVTDLKDAEEVNGGYGGWREIKRLVELKYIVGGWDLQVAVVRRH